MLITTQLVKMLDTLLFLLCLSPPLIHASCNGLNCTTVQFSRQNAYLGNPCSPSPCGPNTWCEVSSRHSYVAQCRCLDGFFPDVHTINGCKPQCTSDDDCDDDYRCQRTKCVRVCGSGSCGVNAHCEADDHEPKCSCKPGYIGDPKRICRMDDNQLSQINDDPDRYQPREDPCQPNPCGVNAQCRTSPSGLQAICSCPRGYLGDPMRRCTQGECVVSSDCPAYLACQGMQCVNPCSIPNVCGRDAECTTVNHVPTCSCPRGFTGNPLIVCRNFEQGLCEPSPCGAHTMCKVRTNPYDRAVCSCKEGYIGNPLVACRPECERHSDCPSRMACEANRCANPCMDACGPNAYCDVHNGRAVCSCPRNYKGNPERGCYAECLQHSQCPSFQACYQLECVDPCIGSCGVGAICRVENHYPICSCPMGYTGHPFERCRPFTDADYCTPNPCGTNAECNVGLDKNGEKCPVCSCPRGFIGNPLITCQRGNCETDNHCPRDQVCHQYTCQIIQGTSRNIKTPQIFQDVSGTTEITTEESLTTDIPRTTTMVDETTEIMLEEIKPEDPCHHLGKSVCGTNANCVVRNRQPVCSCPPGYIGDARQECYARSFNKEIVIPPN